MQAVQFLLAAREGLSTEKSGDLNVKDDSSINTKKTEPQKVDTIQVSFFFFCCFSSNHQFYGNLNKFLAQKSHVLA